MNRQHAAVAGTLPPDRCEVASCIRKLFNIALGNKVRPDYHITAELSEIREELAALNPSGTVELRYEYLQALQTSMPKAAMRYMTVYKQGRPVLFAYFQLFTITSHNFSLGEEKSFSKGLLSFFLDIRRLKVLLSGNVLRTETPCCAFDPDILNAREVAELLACAASDIAAADRADAIMLKDVPGLAGAERTLLDMGFTRPLPDQVMVMPVSPQWKSLVDYVAALSRKYKARANKVIASRAPLTFQQLDSGDVSRHEHAMHRLFKAVADNQPFRLASLSNNHFTQLKNLYGDRFEVHAIMLHSKLIGFYTAFVTDTVFEVYYVGIDYRYNEEYNLYFNILFASLERAIELGKTELKLGRTSFDAKASLGARPASVDYYVKTLHLPQAVVKWLTNYFTAMETGKWKQRNPLKEA